MKKFLYVILTALAALPFVACQEQEEVYKPEVKDITVASVKNLVFLPAGGTGTITVDCATSFTATSDKNWCTVSVSGNDVTVTASANTSNESRYATVLMQTSQSSQKVVVQQVGMVLDGLQLHDERVMVEGETFVYRYSANLPVQMSSDKDWIHFEMIDDEDEGQMVKVIVDPNPGLTRFATVSFVAGSKTGTAEFIQSPTPKVISGWDVAVTDGQYDFPKQIDKVTVTPASSSTLYEFEILFKDVVKEDQVQETAMAHANVLWAEIEEKIESGEIDSAADALKKGAYAEEFENLPRSVWGVVTIFDERGIPTGEYYYKDVQVPDRGPVKRIVDGWEIAHVGGTYAYPNQTDQFTITPKAGFEDVKYVATVVGKDAVADVEDFAFTTFALDAREEILAKVASGELPTFEDGLFSGVTTLDVDNMAGDDYVVVVAFGDNKFYTGDYAVAEFAVPDVMPTYYKWAGKWTLTGTYFDDTPYTEVVTISVDEDDRSEDGSLRERRLIISGFSSKAVEAWGAPEEINQFYLKYDSETGAITFYGQNTTGTFTRSGLGEGCKLQFMSMYVKEGATSYTSATGFDIMSATLDGESAAQITILERSAGLPWLVARIRCLNAAGSAYTTTGANDAGIKLDQPLTMTRAD